MGRYYGSQDQIPPKNQKREVTHNISKIAAFYDQPATK